MTYDVDFDFFKFVLSCQGAHQLRWRVSASRKGFHFRWECAKRWCKQCKQLKKRYDDPRRYRHDLQRPRHHRYILWDRKGNKYAGPWHTV